MIFPFNWGAGGLELAGGYLASGEMSSRRNELQGRCESDSWATVLFASLAVSLAGFVTSGQDFTAGRAGGTLCVLSEHQSTPPPLDLKDQARPSGIHSALMCLYKTFGIPVFPQAPNVMLYRLHYPKMNNRLQSGYEPPPPSPYRSWRGFFIWDGPPGGICGSPDRPKFEGSGIDFSHLPFSRILSIKSQSSEDPESLLTLRLDLAPRFSPPKWRWKATIIPFFFAQCPLRQAYHTYHRPPEFFYIPLEFPASFWNIDNIWPLKSCLPPSRHREEVEICPSLVVKHDWKRGLLLH